MNAPHSITLRREPGPLTRSLTALLLRLGLGLVFLVNGFHKLEAVHGDLLPTEARDTNKVEVEADEVDADADLESDADADAENAELDTESTEAAKNDSAEDQDDNGPKYPESIHQMFAGTLLETQPPGGLELFTTVLPYAEFALGLALILGLLTTLSSFLTGFLILVLMFGWLVKQESSMYPNMLIYLLVDIGVLWLSPVTSNYLSVDGLVAGWFWKPRAEGEYQIDEAAMHRRERA